MKSGMPQLDPSSFPSQLFWLTVAFVSLYFIMTRFLLPRMHDVLEMRQSRISHDIDRAAEMKAEAERARATYERSLADARAVSQQMVAATLASIKESAEKKGAELEAALVKKLSAADAEIARAKREAMEQMTPVTAELTGLIVETLIRHKPTSQQVDSAVGEFVKHRQA